MPNPTHVVVSSTRREWSREEKKMIVAQTRTSSVSAVARQLDISTSLIFRWRRELAEEQRAASLPTPPAFIPLTLPGPASPPIMPEMQQPSTSGVIEIDLHGGHRLRLNGAVDAELLECVLGMLVTP